MEAGALSVNGPGHIAARFAADDGDRTESLDRARLCAALTKPSVLPPDSHAKDTKLPEAYQSIGAWGVTNFVGAMHAATFPAGLPWFAFGLPVNIQFNPRVSARRKQDMANDLWMFQMAIQTLVDASHLSGPSVGNRQAAAFFSRQYASFTQLAVTGDTLEQVMDDYRIKVYRRDKYVTRRDSCGDILYHITSEMVDPLSAMTRQQREKCKLDEKRLAEQKSFERMVPLFTLVEWQPVTKVWKITQEVNGHECNVSEETISPYLCTPYELVAGEDYGRGFVEQSLGDLRSVNNLEKKILEFAAMCSKFHPCPDQNCMIDRNDLKADSGTVIEGFRVGGGEIQDMAWLKVDKYPDFQVVDKTVVRKYSSLARAMLIESEITPQKERTTAFQVSRVVQQLQSATGGMSSAVTDSKTIPLIRRLVHMVQKDKLLPQWPAGMKIEVLTGLAAMSRQAKLGNILQVLDVLGRVSPKIVERFDEQTIIDVIMRYSNVYEPGMIKSDAQMAAEQQRAIAGQIQMAAGEKTVDVMGNVAEANLTQQATGVAA